MLMRRDHLLQWIKPIRQARSLETLERMLDAAEALILERGLEAASVAAVVKRARSSVGAFYARFPDKDSLLRAVCRRFVEQAVATADVALQPADWEDVPLEEVMGTVLRFTVRMGRDKAALLACLVTEAGHDPALADVLDELALQLGGHLHRFLEARGELPKASHPERLVHMLASVLLNVVQVAALRNRQRASRWDDSVVSEELTRLCLGYLGVQPAPAPQVPRARKSAPMAPQRRGV